MKFEKSLEICALGGIAGHAISCEPVLVEPDIEKQDRHEPCEVEDIFLDWDPVAERRGENAKHCAGVGKREEQMREEKVGKESGRHQHRNGPQECFLRYSEMLCRHEPEENDGDGNDEEQQADGVAVRRRLEKRRR